MTDLRALKIEAARAALQFVQSNMVLGLGTGSTAEEFVKLLGDELKAGRITNIRGVCTSRRTEDLARNVGISIIDIRDLARVDVAIDGADEIDPKLRLIKGRGAALLREKIVEQAADRFVVISDHTKEVDRLGAGLLPVAVIPFGRHLLEKRFDALRLEPQLRVGDAGPVITDDGLEILDVKIPSGLEIGEVVDQIRRFAGVVETGFFENEATDAIIASPHGIRHRKR